MHPSDPVLAPLRNQRGVSLIVAMLMLVIIGLASAAIIRNATSADRAVTNNRLQTQANQYAQIALQFCESQLPSSTKFTIPTTPPSPPQWTQVANWVSATATYTLTANDLSGAAVPVHFPKCMAEPTSTSLPYVYTVTARGFSDDWSEDPTSHATLSGSVVWLQSTVQLH